jgi:hypothetical protein
MRYEQLEIRMTKIERDLDRVRTELGEVKSATQKGFEDIKTMLLQAKDEKFKIMVTATGSVLVGLLGMLGYVITHVK